MVPFLVQDRQLLCYASDDLRADPEVAVHGSLEHAAEALKSDLDFVIRRCATYPHDIKFASYGLRLDFDNALDIVSRAGMTLGDVLYKTSQFSEAQYKQLCSPQLEVRSLIYVCHWFPISHVGDNCGFVIVCIYL